MATRPSPPLPPPQDPLVQLRRSPVPLNAAQEAEVRALYYKRVRAKCADEIRGTSLPLPAPPIPSSNPRRTLDFAACATGRTFSIPFACRAPRLAMERCMNVYATRAEEDAAREAWFATLAEREAEGRAEEARKEEMRRRKREWWKEYSGGVTGVEKR